MITFEEFKKLEIITARIMGVRDHPNADKLFILDVDTGECPVEGKSAPGGRKEIVAGIKNSYAKNDLIGKDIVMVNNLAPAIIRGVESKGMLLAAIGETEISIIVPEKTVKPGSKIR